MDTQQVIREAIAQFAQAPLPADASASLFDSGVIDSFGLMDLIAELEKSFGVKVPDSELVPRKFETITKIAAYFDARRG